MDIRPIREIDAKKFREEWDKVATSVVWDPKFYKVGAFEGDEHVGYAIFDTNGGVGYLAELIVEEKSRGKGYGLALMRHFMDFCRNEGCHKLTLKTSEEHSEAIRFYESLGFSAEAVHKDDRNHLTWYTYSMFLRK